MVDSAHDKEHIYRVLYLALDIANNEKEVDQDILIAACLLHDIGREAQYKDPQVCHAQVGAEMAYDFCMKQGFSQTSAQHIKECISTHRFRGDNKPVSMEAKILFDADKLDVSGTMGIARTLLYKGIVGEPLYNTDEKGDVLDDTKDGGPSFLQEYNCKLKNIYANFYTKRAKEIALERQQSAALFYENLVAELLSTYNIGKHYLSSAIVKGNKSGE